MYTITDEELNTVGQLDQDPRYTIRDNNGNVIQDNVKIELKTPVLVTGTDINKATLEGIQTDLMNETKLIVAEYTATSDVGELEITNLDLDNDGGIYEILINGGFYSSGQSNPLYCQINNVTSNYYNYTSSLSTAEGFDVGNCELNVLSYFFIARNSAHDGYKILGQQTNGKNGQIYVNNTQGYVAESNNLTKITFKTYAGSSFQIKAGTQIRVIKRR